VNSDDMYTNRERYRKKGRQTLLTSWIVLASNNYDCDGQGSLHATVQSKSSYMKILKV
jgi:hypothetical protein